MKQGQVYLYNDYDGIDEPMASVKEAVGIAEDYAKEIMESDPGEGILDMEKLVRIYIVKEIEEIKLPFQKWHEEIKEDIEEYTKEDKEYTKAKEDKEYIQYLELKEKFKDK